MTLTAPRLFQLDSHNQLDLQFLNPPNPGNQGDEGDPVVVSVLLPDSNAKYVIVTFGSKSKKFPIANPSRVVIDCPFLRSELPPTGNSYDVSYECGGQHSPAVTVNLIDSMAPFVPRYIVKANGVYPAGSRLHPSVIGVWAVPSFRLLLQNDPIIVPVGEPPSSDAALKIVWKPYGGEAGDVGDIVYDAGGGQWNATLKNPCLTLERSDLILVQSIVTSQQMLNFSLLL
ncbi:hypothetical protein [Trinickia sp.]|uniref:hypothetical protein n=1 Tax=Trinickia sp. TaxID=2571163 RepID=UPI003F7DCFE1